MRNRRKVLLSLLAGFILLASLLAFNLHQSIGQTAAREKLDSLLGQDNPEESPPIATQEAQNPFEPPQASQNQPDTQSGSLENGQPELPGITGGSFFGMPMPLSGTGVDVQELADKYVLRIPLADPQDASSVKLNVSPHHIEVSGQTGTRENGATVNSSFMQSFTTSQEVNPDRISRHTEKNGENTELVVTIPKKTSGSSPDGEDGDAQSTGNSGGGPSQQDEDTAPPPNPQSDPSNPFNGIENKVI